MQSPHNIWQTILMFTLLCFQPTTTNITKVTTKSLVEEPVSKHKSFDAPKICVGTLGCLQGKYMSGFEGENFEAYLGIPYALPPVGELRFANPKEFRGWNGILDAAKPKPNCLQKNYILPVPVVDGVEDCLYLNVYSPIIESQRSLPVMVYIHGGGWFSGTASPLFHGPEYLMDTNEVILVTIAYRLGPFGFLSTNDANMPGNLGLKDQNLALLWIKRNIVEFGGDPEKITLFGQSAGAVSAHLHVLSKQSEGLFRSIIAMSGTANVPFSITENPLQQTRTFAKFCNISHSDELSTSELVQELRHMNATDLLNAGDGLKYWHIDHMTNFRPIVETHGTPDAFLTDHPVRLLSEGKYKAVPWMTGIVLGEGAVRVLSILANETLRQDFNSNFRELLQKLLDFPKFFDHGQRAAKTQQIIDEYFDGQAELNNITAHGFLECITDRAFHQPFYNVVNNYIRTVDAKRYPIYLYQFNYKGPYSFAKFYTGGVSIGDFGVVHCDDLIYTFRAPALYPDFQKGSNDAKFAALFVGNLVHFAKYGKPRNADALRPCTEDTFGNESDSICDYQEFINAEPNELQIRTNNKFNVRRAKLWNSILDIESSCTII
ncbi:juvenile hormone esterase-like [Eurosta solidaginis]|uniref:juvenile hormone esterase-like n=1 Tax=Eurosta solidaginis TaxID=178769 RepID=UPI003530F097